VLKREDGSDRIVFIRSTTTKYIELFAENPKQDGYLITSLSLLTQPRACANIWRSMELRCWIK